MLTKGAYYDCIMLISCSCKFEIMMNFYLYFLILSKFHQSPTTVKPVYKGHSIEPENVPFICRLKFDVLFINGKNETALYRQ